MTLIQEAYADWILLKGTPEQTLQSLAFKEQILTVCVYRLRYWQTKFKAGNFTKDINGILFSKIPPDVRAAHHF